MVMHLSAAIALLTAAAAIRAQQPADSVRCDSIVRISVVDTVETSLYITLRRLDDGPEPILDAVAATIVGAFRAPKPFRLSVFAGPPRMRGLRPSGADTAREIREASIAGVYALWVTTEGPTEPVVLRSSLMRGLDSSMVRAIVAPSRQWRQVQRTAGLAARYQVRVSTDSTPDSYLLAFGRFPRMRVNDATPARADPLSFPEEARADSLDHGETVLRFVVDRDGRPALETAEIVRSTAPSFTRAALVALNTQTFKPATISGCPVAQLVEFPFIFDARKRPPPAAR